MDFQQLHPNKTDNFINKFEEFSEKVMPIFRTKAKTLEAKTWLRDLDNSVLDDGRVD
jgi:hypothetical protein